MGCRCISAAILLFPVYLSSAELSLETRPVAPGGKATLSLFARDIRGVGYLACELEYDWSALTLVGVQRAGLVDTGDSTMLVATHPEQLPDASGRLRCAVATAAGLGNEGRVLDLVFQVADSADGFAAVRLVEASAADTAGLPLPVDRRDGGFSAVTAVAGEVRARPGAPALLPNFPNPFNPTTTLPFQLAESAAVELRIYNIMGQLVRVFALGRLEAGYYDGGQSMATWDGRDLSGRPVASGVYLIRLQADEFVAVRKSLLLR